MRGGLCGGGRGRKWNIGVGQRGGDIIYVDINGKDKNNYCNDKIIEGIHIFFLENHHCMPLFKVDFGALLMLLLLGFLGIFENYEINSELS